MKKEYRKSGIFCWQEAPIRDLKPWFDGRVK
jgi:hypothetical protein